MSIKVLLADDEEHVRQELEHIINQNEHFQIEGLAATGTEALQLLTTLKPDAVFLDIEMPGLTGIEIGNIINQMKEPPIIVYVTAYENYALEAFKVNALGYILKPISSEDVLSKIGLIQQLLIKSPPENQIHEQKSQSEIITYKDQNKFHIFEQRDIILAYAKDRSVYLRVKGKDYLYNQTLTTLESKLNAADFFRCHRNYLINIREINEITSWFNGTYLVTMKNAEDLNIIVSRTRMKEFKQKINL
ncbi:LytR/AlgR family response regulator transcription factor [Bacillus dakarensis]|uniref:LytR/AlgR family response regulator transcription factor n=1 Tax=Robertmurraya dakarensis TaxID=1926278 RepID=UPI00098215E8|nr:LytTR family DNA-binding domain-containing protein [Bacillus dakarensis]